MHLSLVTGQSLPLLTRCAAHLQVLASSSKVLALPVLYAGKLGTTLIDSGLQVTVHKSAMILHRALWSCWTQSWLIWSTLLCHWCGRHGAMNCSGATSLTGLIAASPSGGLSPFQGEATCHVVHRTFECLLMSGHVLSLHERSKHFQCCWNCH